MAKKKRDSGGQGPKRRGRSRRNPEPPLHIPDRRAMEGILRQLTGGPAGGGTPLDQAQDLMYQAFEEEDPERRVELARQALATSPDCADAYVLLAQHSPH